MNETAMETRNGVVGALLGLHALTSLHPGSGTALGAVDLPVQRERHTGWPMIPGSAIKGVLRDSCREQIAARADLDDLPRYDDKPEKRAERGGTRRDRADATILLTDLFGPPTVGASEFAGALSVTDARILAFPVRSLKGVFGWVTSAEALRGLRRSATMLGYTVPWVPLDPLDVDHVLVSSSKCLIDGKTVVLEDADFTKVESNAATAVAEWIAENLLPEKRPNGDELFFGQTRSSFLNRFLVVPDDDFTGFVKHSTEITTRIKLSYETKTVEGKALFSQEFLPPETLFYCHVLAGATRARRKSSGSSPHEHPLDRLRTFLPDVLQIGGDETTGKGLCAIRLSKWRGADV